MLSLDSKIKNKLAERTAKNAYRTLREYPNHWADFCSNDYLGFARNKALRAKVQQRIQQENIASMGSTGSRLISGNTGFCEALESKIARFHQAEAGLIFNSGYDANLALFSCLTDRNDTIIYDALVHASIRDGIRLSTSKAFAFRHNDLADLEKKLQHAQGQTLIAIESIYSMDGDAAPLESIVQLAKQYNAAVVVDEAHATGVIGAQGKGLVVAKGLENEIYARVHTFGKALGTHGAIVLSNDNLRNYLINFARSFIYTTALPQDTLVAIEESYNLLEDTEAIDLLKRNLDLFDTLVDPEVLQQFIPSDSLIKSLVIPGNATVKAMAQQMQDHQIAVKAILAPTVASGQERLRICLHSFNTESEINTLAQILNHRSIVKC